MGVFDFFKRARKPTETELDEAITNSNKPSTNITNNQQIDSDLYSKRDLQYARRIGQIEEMSENISKIKDKLTALDVKFDLRVPDRVLTETRFEKEALEGRDILEEIESIKKSLEELEKTITNKQQLSTIGNIMESTEKIEMDLREAEIRQILKSDRITTYELAKKLGLSRSRTNQILLEMENKGLVMRIKYGKKYLWSVSESHVKLNKFVFTDNDKVAD